MSLPKPYFQDSLVTLYFADCREVLPDISDVTSVITDPPYELGFMGKEWDKQGVSFDPHTWKLVLNSCKSGAPLLAFGGTRTQHRIVCAIEDGGWEIRDTLMWLYGSGFPKSLDISKAIDKALYTTRSSNPDFQEVRAWIRAKVKAKGLSYRQIDAALGNENSHMASHFLDNSQPALPSPDNWQILKGLLGLSDETDIDRPPKLLVETFEREIIGYRKVQRGVAFTSEGPDELPITKPISQEAEDWQGYGTALKPAWEPICLAMKPLDGTFAHNALTHGVAGLNIDGCRIGTGQDKEGGSHPRPCSPMMGGGITQRSEKDCTTGRWPANLLLSHTPECKCVGTKKLKSSNKSTAGGKRTGGLYGEYAGFETPPPIGYADVEGNETVESWECTPECPVRMLDEQSGDCSSHWLGNARGVGAKGGKMFGGNEQIRPVPKQEYLDIGGASRFFYCAKADRAERDAGCEEMSEVSVSYMNTHGGDAEKGETWHPIDDRTGQKRDRFSAKARNDHPTVKPLSLMIYLTKLVSPPKDALILDPFMGSGTEGKACQQLGIRFIGIDNNERNCAIAAKRMSQSAFNW